MPRRAANLQTTEKGALDSRAEVLLAALIKEHLVTGEAVGSRVLSDRFAHGYGWSPATIRNVMAELEDAGFVEQPHTSAGRVPTDKGYRYYVDNILGEARLSRTDLKAIDHLFSMHDIDADTSPDRLMETASHVLSALSQNVENRSDMLGVLEAQFFLQTVNKKRLPTMLPVNAHFNASGFGMRIDPITGQQAMHEGIDFIADTGAPVVAAAGGIVQFAGYHPQYGHVVDIDHGNDLITRYAHLSRMLVEEGAIVNRGRKIGETGSSGRSTGPHLHFEVRFKGAPQNPARFLLSNGQAVAARGR